MNRFAPTFFFLSVVFGIGVGWNIYGLVLVTASSFTILCGGLVAGLISLLNLEFNKESKRKDALEKRCEKLEDLSISIMSDSNMLDSNLKSIGYNLADYENVVEQVKKVLKDADYKEDVIDANNIDIVIYKQTKKEKGWGLDTLLAAKQNVFGPLSDAAENLHRINRELGSLVVGINRRAEELLLLAKLSAKMYSELNEFGEKVAKSVNEIGKEAVSKQAHFLSKTKSGSNVKFEEAYTEEQLNDSARVSGAAMLNDALIKELPKSFGLIDHSSKRFSLVSTVYLVLIVFIIFLAFSYSSKSGYLSLL